ncbi:class I adenylate-forming enzyme family protein [Rhodococcus erythropolis]|uniref:class I adenylate-forming enzyme family protein n=1 Tax=Rhodococcus erythropolis TaxID=1833 RepID=UPI0024B831B0|nr:AMP-binding protein [Rhodococcus erythropolis]MDJ0015492.1 AMP-binding protein [Rhodococcus erythropolis]
MTMSAAWNLRQDWYSPDVYSDRMPPFRRLLVERLLGNAARQSPNRPAVYADGEVITFSQLDEMANRTANSLVKAGVRQGDVVALNASNTPETLAATFGIARLGAAILPINPMNTAREIEFQMEDAHASILLGTGGLDIAKLIADGDPVTPEIEVNEQDPYWVRFTSGTTGQPRSFPNSQRNITIQCIYTAAELRYRSDDILLINAPLAHAALIYALSALAVGAAIALEPFNADTVWQDCDRLGVTQVFMVPTMLSNALENPGKGDTIRGILVTASTFPKVIRERVKERFPNADIMEGYGASELGMVSVLHRNETDGENGIGRARWGTRVRILDPEGIECPVGEVGTIYVQGPIVSGGFTGKVPAPEYAFRDGWVTAGDMGYVDENGYIYLVDRRHDLIISGGLNVYPTEVENAVMDVEGVREVAVVGAPHEKWGQRVTAVVAGTATAEQITEHCRSVLAAYKIPREILIVDELPKSSTGKILRRLAVDMVAQDKST